MFRAQPRPRERNGECMVPLFFGKFNHRFNIGMGGIAHQDVELTKVVQCRLHQCLPGTRLADITRHGDCFPANCADLTLGFKEPFLTGQRVDHDLSTLLGKAVGGRATDPTPAGTGYNGYFSC